MVKSINLKLDEEKDIELINFLVDKPNTFIFKEALKMYMKNYTAMFNNPIAVVPVAPGPTTEVREKKSKASKIGLDFLADGETGGS